MSFNPSRPATAALWTLAVLALAGSSWFAWRQFQPAAPPPPVLRLAAVPFANLTGDPAWDGAALALPAAAARQAQGLPNLRAFTAHTSSQALALDATHLLEGFLAPAPGGIEIHLTLSSAIPSQILSRHTLRASAATLPQQAIALARLATSPLRPGAPLLPLDIPTAAFLPLGDAFTTPSPATRVQKLRSTLQSAPDCGWCWEELASATLRAEGPASTLALLKDRPPSSSPLAEARLALLAANLAPTPPARLQALQRLAQLTPADPDVLTPLADALVQANRPADAVPLYQRTFHADPARSAALNSAAYALAWAGQPARALPLLAQYEQAEPASPNPADSRGEILLIAGRFPEAEQAFLASHEKDPAFQGGAALEKAALARWLTGDAQAAGALLERFLKQRLEAGDPLATFRRAQWQFLFGQSPEALANLRRLASQPSPASSLAAASLALHELEAGRPNEAAQLAALARLNARSAIALYAATLAEALTSPNPVAPNPSSPLPAELEAIRLTLHAQLPQAESELRRILPSLPPASAPLARELLAQLLAARGDAPAAASLLQNQWPLLTPDQSLLFDFLIYPNLLATRAAITQNPEQSRALYDQFLRFHGKRPDPLKFTARARAASRL